MEGDLLATHVVNYFQSFFSTNPTRGSMEFLSKIEPLVNEPMCVDLSCDFTKNDLVLALK